MERPITRRTMARTTRRPSVRTYGANWGQRIFPAGDILAFVLGLSASFNMHIIGSVQVIEMLLPPTLLLLFAVHTRERLNPIQARVILLMLLWLANQILTDMYRGTAFVDWVRGDAGIVFFGVNLVSLMLLLQKNERRKAIFIAAFALSMLLQTKIQPSDQSWDDPWKFGYGWGATILTVLVSCYFFHRRQFVTAWIFVAGIIGVHLVENYRSMVLILLVMAALVMPIVPDQIGRLKILPRAGNSARVYVLAAFAMAAGGAAIGLVHFATSHGLISAGQEAKNRTELHSSLGPLLSGRPEILVSSRAVLESPILGHGSWAKGYKYIEMLSDIEERNGIHTALGYTEETSLGYIPTHSHLMGAWVSAGILGGVFWMYVLSLSVKGLMRVSVLRPPLAPVYALFLVEFIWSILFSPFGGSQRIESALVIVILFDLLDQPAVVPEVVRSWMPSRKWRRASAWADRSSPSQI